MKVFLVDDCDEFREALRITLVTAGHEVTVARNGGEACALMREKKMDVLVADIFMPEGDGFEVIREFRRTLRPGPWVAMSGRRASCSLGKLCLDVADKLGADAFCKSRSVDRSPRSNRARDRAPPPSFGCWHPR